MSKFFYNTPLIYRRHSTMLSYRRILGVLFLIGYEALFIYCLVLSIHGIQRNQDAYDAFREARKSYQENHDDASFYLEELNMDGYNEYLDYSLFVLISFIFVAWPGIIFIIFHCCQSKQAILPTTTINEPLLPVDHEPPPDPVEKQYAVV